MAKFTGTFMYLIEIEHDFEIDADNKAEALEKIKNDPLEYTTDFVSGFERDGQAVNIEFEG